MLKIKFLTVVGLVCILCQGVLAEKVKVIKVWPGKIRYNPGEKAEFQLKVENTTGNTLTIIPKLEITGNLDNRVTLTGEKQTLTAKEKKDISISWNVPESAHFGYEVTGWVEEGMQVVSNKKKEYFAVGRNGWVVGRYTTFFTMGKRDLKNLDRWINEKRNLYVMIAEHFSGSPGVYTDMAIAPGKEEWVTHQGWYYETRKNLDYLISEGHKQGIQFIAYTACRAYGPSALRVYREYPECVNYSASGKLYCQYYSAEKLRKVTSIPPKDVSNYGRKHKVKRRDSLIGEYLWGEEKTLDIGVDEIFKAVETHKFDGIRWDGHPSLGMTIQGTAGENRRGYKANINYRGEPVKIKDRDDYNYRIMHYMNEKIRKRYPELLLGYNIAQGGMAERQKRGTEYTKSFTYLAKDAYCLWEGLRSSRFYDKHPLHKWRDYAKAVIKENFEYWRPKGGYLHGGWHGGGPVYDRHMAAVMFASGLHWDTWAKCREMFQFAVRYGGFLWDRRIKLLENPKKSISIENKNVWWEDFPQILEKDGRTYLIVHLLNPARKEEQFPEEKKAPEPLKSFPVSLTTKLEGKTLQRVFFLMPREDDIYSKEFLVSGSDKKQFRFTTPEPIPYWAMVVGEYK